MTKLADIAALVTAAGLPPAVSDIKPIITANQETWRATTTSASFDSATAAHQFVRYNQGIAQASADAAAPVDLAGV
jgi:hypothetical protein